MADLDLVLTKNRLLASHGNLASAAIRQVAEFRAVPPPALRPLHDAQFASGIWAQVQFNLADPAQITPLSHGALAVRILDTAIFVRGKTGQLHPFLLESSGELIRPGSAKVMVTEIPYGSIWLDRLTLNLVRAKKDWPDEQAVAYASWLAKVFKRRIRTSIDMRKVRAQIAFALGMDANAWRLCHRLKAGSSLYNKASLHQYNVCVRNKAALLEIERDAPQALGIYAALCESVDFPAQGEPTQRLKRYLVSAGLNSRTWLLAIRSGTQLLALVQQFYHFRGARSVIDSLKIMQGLGLAKALPDWLSQAMFAEWGNAGARRDSYLVAMAPFMVNLRHMTDCLLQWKEKPTAQQEEQIAEVVHWLCEPSTAAFTRTQRQGGWEYLAREAKSFCLIRDQEEAARDLTWNVPFQNLQAGALSLLTMNSALQLLEEGRRMRNCAASLIQACSSGKELLVSVRETGAKRIATASYKSRDGKWVFADAKGPMNRPLPLRTMTRLRRAAECFPAQ